MEQPYLKKGGLIGLVAVLSMIPPLSTDLYMPALPEMVHVFNTTTTLMSMTMTIFFLFMAVGILILGPISDKYGRKKILVFSIILTFLFSVSCAFATSIWMLIIFRAIQAFGAGGMVAIATALLKDSFDGKEMGKVLSITQALLVLAPMLAPLLGALILKFSDWKMTFIALAILNFLTLIGALLLRETLPSEKRIQEGVIHSIFGLGKVVKNTQFTSLLLVGAMLSAPFMAYLAVASYVYINGFGVSETTFSIYFAITSALGAIGPMVYMKFGAKSLKKVMMIAFIIISLVGIAMLTIGKLSPVLFLISYVPFAIMTMYLRPYISELLLQAQSTNIGAASAVMNFGFTIIGSIGMLLGSLKWNSYINGIAITIFIFTFIALIIFIFTWKKNLIIKNDSL